MSDQAIGRTGKLFAASKADETTRSAREIIDRETAARDAKTARLRLARLEKEKADAKAAMKPKPKGRPTKTAEA
ncbi:hypothetical protein [Hansschlegelia plantiphila]|uniref:Uncharacterized protein n=1 Tax=Hansschlegelia plantiphila TaxID=374655 RepID=A0A9W6J016_9HYPH|nr:hypothetical protein [Hansschlegelia plantiphila]GLK67837.1 hypothetical protein GCM10008179_14750 [Hansschlegelia plantiphila]